MSRFRPDKDPSRSPARRNPSAQSREQGPKKPPPHRVRLRGRDGPTDQEEVGYCKPPKRSQFQPGESGNPKGRPRGSRNLATNVKRVMSRKISVVERGKRKSVTAAEAILHRYLERAIGGDVKAGAFLLSLLERFQPSQIEDSVAETVSDDDQKILDNLFKRLRDKDET